jgi:transposase-like protein
VRASIRVPPVRAMPNLARAAQKFLQLSEPIPVPSSEQHKHRYSKHLLFTRPMSAHQNSNSKGKRYSEAEKAKILNHVEQANSKRGRGGITSAAKKYGVTALTISNWLRANEPLALSMRSTNRNSNAAETLRRLAEIHEKIVEREHELLPLRREFEKLKRSL